VLLEGPAGIGKTRLLAEARRLASDRGARTLTARGSEFEHDFAFGVARQLFEPLLAGGDEDAERTLLQGAAALAGPLLGLEPHAVQAETTGAETFGAMHGLYWVCANAAQREPLLLTVDDVHLADPPSLRFLAYLARRVEELPVLLALAARPHEADGSDLLRALAVEPSAEVLQPRPLTQDAVASLLATALEQEPDERFAAACHAATGGVPFLVYELAAALREDRIEPTAESAPLAEELGPRTIARSILVRLGRLAPASSEFARTVAILGGGVDLRHAAELAGLDATEAGAAADALVAAGVLEPGRPLEFVHPVVRTAIYAELAQGERSRRHRAAARVLAAEDEPSERVAAHLLAAEPASDAWTVEVLWSAAREAFTRGAPDSAAVYLHRALVEPAPERVRTTLLTELGAAETHAGNPAGLAHLELAFETPGDLDARADAALMLGRGLVLAHEPTRAAQVFARAASLGRDDLELELMFESAVVGAAELDGAIAHLLPAALPRLRARAEAADAVPAAVDSVLAFWAAISNTSAEEAAERGERALRKLTRPYPGEGDPHLFFHACAALLFSEQFELVRPFYDHALEDAQRAGSLPRFAAASCFRSSLNYRTGELADAEADARLALEATRSVSLDWYLPFATAMLLQALVERGELEEAERELEASDSGIVERTTLSSTILLAARGRLRLAQELAADGAADLLATGERLTEMGARSPALSWWRSDAALAQLQLGNPSEARRLAAEELQLGRSFGTARATGVALRAAGVVEGPSGLDLLEEAVDVLERAPARLEHARARIELGSAHRRAGRRGEARDQLRGGLDLAHRCGAHALADRARAELVAAGARPRRRVLRGVEALTPSELRIARLAAERRSNREIAQALFVTARTVETHLTHAYQKLAISSRDELPRALAEAETSGGRGHS
jgi:DNA-binding CsgD family transcriptional regulator